MSENGDLPLMERWGSVVIVRSGEKGGEADIPGASQPALWWQKGEDAATAWFKGAVERSYVTA